MPSLERAVWLSVMLTWTLGVMTLTWEHRKPTWVIFSLIAAQAGTLLTPHLKTIPARLSRHNSFKKQFSTVPAQL
jgi:hypothetical protein